MNIVYLNGEYAPIKQVKISPLDRGFLFGDGIYDVIPAYSGKMVGFERHINRLNSGCNEIFMEPPLTVAQWRAICGGLLERNDSEQVGIYLHVSRGAGTKRSHGFPEGVAPTVFAMLIEIPASVVPDHEVVGGLKTLSAEDRRWKRCDIKSTALLGNVLHFQQALDGECQEIVLFNADDEVTEGAVSNVFIVKGGVVITPLLDHQKLPGITRQLVLDILRDHGGIPVEERIVSMAELRIADEIWLTNSAFEIKPVISLDGELIGDGRPGLVWEKVAKLYESKKFEY